MQNQIKEMATILCEGGCEECIQTLCADWYKAERLYREDYRKQSEVIDEFVKKLKQTPIKCKLPLLGLSTKEEIEEYFDDIMLQVGDAIDRIAKQMKGE